MRFSFRWTQTGRRGPRISQRVAGGRAWLARLALVAATTACLTPVTRAVRGASFDDTFVPDNAASVLLHEPGFVPLASAPADDSSSLDHDAEPAFTDSTDVVVSAWPNACTGEGGDSCSCPASSGQTGSSTGLLNTLGSACADGLCRRGPLGDGDPQGVFQSLARHRKQGGIGLTGRADALILFRNAPASRPLFDSNPPTAIPALDANQLQSGATAGARLSLFRQNPCGDAWELTYLYAGRFTAQRNLPPTNGGYLTADPGIYGNDSPPVNALDSANALLTGQLQSAEVNRRWALGRNIQFLGGFRWLNWYESLAITDAFTGGQDAYNTACTNNLYGGQIGLDALLWNHCPTGFRVETLLKAGAYANNAMQTSSIVQSDALGVVYQDQITVAKNPLTCSFVGEVGMTGVLPISNCWDFRFGYVGLWLASLAQPSGQLSGQNLAPPGDQRAGSIAPNGLLVLQGVSLGLEGRW